MAKIDDDVAAVIALWNDGMMANGEVTTRLIDLLTATNIDEVVGATPEPWRKELADHLREIGDAEGPLLTIHGGTFIDAYRIEPDPVRAAAMQAEWDRARATEEEHFENVIRPAIRAWLRGRRPS